MPLTVDKRILVDRWSGKRGALHTARPLSTIFLRGRQWSEKPAGHPRRFLVSEVPLY